MNTSESFKILATSLEQKQGEFYEMTNPFVEQWLSIQNQLDKIEDETAERDYRFTGITDKGIHFECEPWEVNEYYSYWRYGHEIIIPLDFFDDATPYQQQVQDHLDAAEARAKANQRYQKLQQVAKLQAALDKAKQEAGL